MPNSTKSRMVQGETSSWSEEGVRALPARARPVFTTACSRAWSYLMHTRRCEGVYACLACKRRPDHMLRMLYTLYMLYIGCVCVLGMQVAA